MRITILADDLTGACDTGAGFTSRGPVGVWVAPGCPDAGVEVAVVDTESRSLGPAAARARVAETAAALAGRLAGGRLVKKIDSTMRGPVAEEVIALLDTAACSVALVCPAFPAQGRLVVGGILTVHGQAAHLTPVGGDPDYPGPISDLADMLARPEGPAVCLLSLAEVRAGEEALAEALARAGRAIVVADAETDDDLDALARAADRRAGLLLVGSAGLASALARRLRLAGKPPALPDDPRWLFVVGSLHAASRGQLAALESAGVPVARVREGAAPDLGGVVAALAGGAPAALATEAGPAPEREARARMAAALAGAVARVLGEARPSLLVVTGGETALALIRTLGGSHLLLRGAPGSGLALADLVTVASSTPPRRTPPLLTKAGGFGPPDLFLALVRGTRR